MPSAFFLKSFQCTQSLQYYSLQQNCPLMHFLFTFVLSILLSNCPLCIRPVHFYCPLCRFTTPPPPPRRGGCTANKDLRDPQRCLTNSCKYRRVSRTQSRNARHETHERQRRTRRERRWNGFPEHDLDGSKIFVTNISESAILELVSYISI